MCSSNTKHLDSYRFIKDEIWGWLVFSVKEDGSLQTKPGDEDDDGVLPHKQNKSLFIQNASALEE